MRIIGNNPQLSRQTQGTASGAITGGKPVTVNTDGTVTQISGSTSAVGAEAVFESAVTTFGVPVFDSSNNKVVIFYRDDGNSSYGTAIVATIDPSDNSVTYGSPVVFNSANTYYIAPVFDSSNNKIVVAYADGGNSSHGYAIVGTVSGTSISFGSSTQFEPAVSNFISATFDSEQNRVVIAYQDAGASGRGTAKVGTVSGTSVSFGSASVFDSDSCEYISVAFDSNSEVIVIAYRDGGDSNYGKAVVGDVNNTEFNGFGTPVVFENAHAAYTSTTFDSNSNKIVIAYMDVGNSYYGTAVVGTAASDRTISFGTPVVFESGTYTVESTAPRAATFDSSNNKIIIAYADGSNSNKGTVIEGTVSGTSISFGTAVLFNDADSDTYTAIAYDSNSNRSLITYHDNGNSSYGTGVVYATSVPTNITSEAFIGFAQDTVATGQPVTINTKGAIADNIPQIASASSSVGTAVTFDSSSSTRIASCYDSTNNRIVVSYVDTGSDDDGTVAVGTVNASDNSISWGTPVAFNSNVKITDSSIVHDSNSNKIVIGYMDEDNSNYGTGIVGTIDTSDNSISFGSPTVYESASIATSSRNFGVFDSNSNKVIFGYQDDADSNKGKAVVGTVSGTSISFGSPVIFETGYAIHMDATFDTSNNKVVIAYRDYGNSDYGTAVVGTVSGTSISFGTPVVYNSAESDWNSATFDSSNNKVVISYQDKGNSSVGTAIVGTVSGTSISFGSEVVYSSGTATYTYATFDSNLNKVIIGYRNDASSDRGDFVIGTVSGTSISFNSPATFESDAVTWVRAAFDSSAKRTVFTFNEDNSAGKGVVMQPAGILEDIIPAQTYFVQTDGTLSQTADDPSVTAGTAVAGSTLIVKG